MVLLACTILCFECWIIGIVIANRAKQVAYGTIEGWKFYINGLNETDCKGWPDYGITHHSP